VRYGEVALKGRLRRRFEDILVGNIRRVMRQERLTGEIEREWGRIYIHPANNEAKKIAERIAKVFGVVSTSIAVKCSANINEIAKLSVGMVEDMNFNSFAVRARRAGKHNFTSMDVAREAGRAIKEVTGKKVDLNNPDVEVFIEVRDENAYIYTEIFRGYGGLPVGTQDRVFAIGELAAWYALRRGCDVDVDSQEVADAILPYACYRSVGVHSLHGSSREKLLSAFDLEYPAIFSPAMAHELPDYLEVLKARKMPVFMPLLPFTAQEVEEKRKELFP